MKLQKRIKNVKLKVNEIFEIQKRGRVCIEKSQN